MLGITLASPNFSDLARESAYRFTNCTGLRSLVINTTDELNYFEKLRLLDYVPNGESVVFFDADLWFLSPCDLSEFDDREEFMAAFDPCRHDSKHFPLHDCNQLRMNHEVYFNSGLFIANHRHCEVFRLAAAANQAWKLKDFGEQSFLNYGVQKSKVPFVELNQSFNYIPYAARLAHSTQQEQDNALTVHAAGLGHSLKHKFLKHFEVEYALRRNAG